MKTLIVTLILCSVASAKSRPVPAYQNAIFQETHAESVRMNCDASLGYDSSMTTCHDAEMLVYTVKIGETVYTLVPYGTLPHHESLWKQPAGAVAVWKDGKHVHVRTGAKESQYDIFGESVEDAAK